MLMGFLPDGFWVYADTLDCMMNHIGAIAVLAAVVAFAYLACGIFAQALRQVLGPCGIPFFVCVRAVLAFHGSRQAQRAFIEFAIVRFANKTDDGEIDGVRRHGAGMRKLWWGIFNEFRSFWSHCDQSHPVVEVENCTYLTQRDFGEIVSRYFAYLDRPAVAKTYEIATSVDYWQSVIRVKESYITPSVLLSGLLSRYDESWERFISKYISTASMGKDASERFSTNELYGLFAWLLWGPSLEIEWKNGWNGLCQMSYGDENNSLPAFLSRDGDVVGRMRASLLARKEKGSYGVLCSADVRILPKKSFFRSELGRMGVSSANFVDKMAKDESIPFAVYVVDFCDCADHRAEAYYCTAYLWILLERDGDGHDEFRPENAVAFFEHANLADGKSCEFLTRTLMGKVMAHFRMVFESGGVGPHYRFVCAHDRELELRFQSRIEEEIARGGAFAEWLRDSVSVVSRRKVGAVFSTIDEFFEGSEEEFAREEVTPENRLSMADLAVFYSGLYTESFPVEDERESLENIIRYMKASRGNPNWSFNVLLFKDARGVVVAGALFDYFRRSNSAVIEFVTVDRIARFKGLGSRLLREICKTADGIARRAGYDGVDNFFCEVESPEPESEERMGRLKFWERNRFRHLDFEYVQPALDESKGPVRGLWFLALPMRDADTIRGDLVGSVVSDYIRYAMGREDADSDPILGSMRKELAGKKDVALLPLSVSAMSFAPDCGEIRR